MADTESIVNKWAEKNGVEVSASARADLAKELADQAKDKAVDTQQESTWEKVKGCMGWLLLGTGLAVGAGAAVYTFKQATDAVPAAAEEAGKEILQGRMDLVRTRFGVMEQASGDLLLKLMAFMVALKNTATTLEGLEELIPHMWDAVWDTTKNRLATGEWSADASVAQITDLVKKVPALSGAWAQVEGSYAKVTAAKDSFEALGTDLTTATDEDARIFWEDYRKHFWNEMLQKGEGLKTPATSSPALESPK